MIKFYFYQALQLKQTKFKEMDSDDDVFGGVHDMEMNMYQEGFNNGEIEGIKKSKEKSTTEGFAYGKQIGNHMGYYVRILKILKEGKPEKFENNERLMKVYIKLEKALAAVDIKECYEDHFAKDQNKIKKWFQQILSMIKVKSKSDDPKDEIAF